MARQQTLLNGDIRDFVDRLKACLAVRWEGKFVVSSLKMKENVGSRDDGAQ